MQATVLDFIPAHPHNSPAHNDTNTEPTLAAGSQTDIATWQQLADYRSDIAKKLSLAAARLTTITNRLQHTSRTSKARLSHYAVI